MSMQAKIKTFLFTLFPDVVLVLIAVAIWFASPTGEGRQGAVLVAYILIIIHYGLPLLFTLLLSSSLWNDHSMIAIVVVIRLLLAFVLTWAIHRLSKQLEFRRAFFIAYGSFVLISAFSLMLFLPHGTIGPP